MIYILEYGKLFSDKLLTIILLTYISLVVANYIFKSFALYTISKKLNMKDNWMSFIPYLNNYYLGSVVNNPFLAMFITVVVAVSSLTDNIIIVSVFNIIFLITYNYFLYLLFKKITRSYILVTLLSILSLGFFGSIFLFIFRNKKLVKN
jgi:hypothetical protein